MRLGFRVGFVGVLATISSVVASVVASLVASLGASAHAGVVAGRLELPPPPERAPVVAKGFLERAENPHADPRRPNLAPYLVVVLEGEPASAGAPAQVTWELVGESFARPAIGVPVGAEVVIKNVTSFARTLAAREDPKLIAGPLNPTGVRSFRPTQPAVYTIADKDAPHLRGTVVVVASRHVASVDDAGRFEFADVAEGSYKLRVFYANPLGGTAAWLPISVDVAVGAKAGKTEVSAKLPPWGAAAGRK